MRSRASCSSAIRPLNHSVVPRLRSTLSERDLNAGETLDDYATFMTYLEAVNVIEMSATGICQTGLLRAVG